MKSISNGANKINYLGGSSLSNSISFVKNSSGLCFHLGGKPKAEAGPSLSVKQQWGVFLPRGSFNYQLDCHVRKLKRISESSWVQSLKESWCTTRQRHSRLSVCKQGCFPSAGSAGKGNLCRKDYSWFQFSSQVEIRSSDKEGDWKSCQLMESKKPHYFKNYWFRSCSKCLPTSFCYFELGDFITSSILKTDIVD